MESLGSSLRAVGTRTVANKNPSSAADGLSRDGQTLHMALLPGARPVPNLLVAVKMKSRVRVIRGGVKRIGDVRYLQYSAHRLKADGRDPGTRLSEAETRSHSARRCGRFHPPDRRR